MRRFALVAACWVLSTGYAPAADKPVPTKDAAARVTVPEGFRVTLFAGEPDVVQPISFTFDDRGRMWVVECVTYPKWVQPGQKGKDRVIILEDTNGDGVHDKKTVVLDDGVNLSGIELGFGGVYLCSTPNLVFVPLKDDKPSGPPQVLLDGWNLKEAKHNVFNGLAWGPDGWLYGANGIQTKSWVGAPGTPQDKRTFLDCGVWRFHPTKKTFEVVATGTTNPWGVDWNSEYELFITNCVIDHLWHVQPGGKYTRMYGQDANPFAFGYMGPASDHRHWAGGHWTDSRADKATGAVQKGHDDAGGGHAHSGVCVYNGDNFPPEYRDSVFTCNIHGNRVNRDKLHRTATGYVGKHEKDFLNANDPWFRGVCVKAGPDGGLYAADWCDTGECHNYDVADTTNGRIYRVVYGTPKAAPFDLSKLSDVELAREFMAGNEWRFRQARRLLQERATKGPIAAEAVKELTDALTKFDKGHTPGWLLRAYLMLHAVSKCGEAELKNMLAAKSPMVRIWGLRLLADAGTQAARKVSVNQVALYDPDPLVRIAVTRVIPVLPADVQFHHAMILDRHPLTDDQAKLVWYAIQPRVTADPTEAARAMPFFRHSLLRRNMVRGLLTAPGANADVLAEVTHQIGGPPPYERRADVLTGILQAYEDRKQVKPPAIWKTLYAVLPSDKEQPEAVAQLMDEVALKFGDERAVKSLMTTAGDPSKPAARRQWAIERLTPLKPAGFADGLKKWLSDPAIRGAAVRALAAYPDPDVPAAVLKAYPTFTAAEKADAVLTLASRKEFVGPLLDAVEAGTVPKADVTAFAARQILALNDKPTTDRLGKVWGTVQPASATRAAQTKRLKGYLIPDRMSVADLSNGRAVYTKSCAACHKLFGEGGDVGPELTGSQRANLDYVLENTLDPNAAVPFDFKMTAFYLTDGRVVTGLIRKETPQAVTVRTANEEVLLPKADIESRKPTNNSVMPEGLLDALKDEEIRDLVAYLAAKQQVPLK